MTLDQIFFLLCELDNLRGSSKSRIKSTSAEGGAIPLPGKDGLIAGRDKDGNPIRLKIKGESLVAKITREKMEKKRAEAAAQGQKEKKKRRG